MASALRFAARRICGRYFQRSGQRYFTAAAEAAVKEEQRLLSSSVCHGGSSVRRFSSSKSPNLVNNIKHGPNSAAGATKSSPSTIITEPTTPPSLWSPKHPMFFPLALGYAVALCAGCYATIYVQTRLRGGPVVWKAPDDIGTAVWKEPDDIRKKPNN